MNVNVAKITAITAALIALPLVVACSGTSSAGERPPANLQTGQATDPTAGITVTGVGIVRAVPDAANITLGVEVEAASVVEARDQAATASTALITSVKANGVDDADIQTTNISISPRYNYPRDGEPTITGYMVSNSLRVTVRDLDALGAIVDGAVAAGGDDIRVHGISFFVEDNEDAVGQARASAIANARVRADELADAAGVTLGAPVSITENSSSSPPPEIFRGTEDSIAESIPFEPGTQDQRVTVTVRYAIQ